MSRFLEVPDTAIGPLDGRVETCMPSRRCRHRASCAGRLWLRLAPRRFGEQALYEHLATFVVQGEWPLQNGSETEVRRTRVPDGLVTACGDDNWSDVGPTGPHHCCSAESSVNAFVGV